jgi:uroporphyrinogen decarboxylase
MVENGNIFETSWYMRGFERMLMDLVVNPELADAILGRVTDFFVEHFRRILERARGRVDLVFTADDIGGQEGLLMSPATWEERIKPFHARLNRVIHEFGTRVIYHTDGSVMPAVPGLIDMGIDVLQALQFDAKGMDPLELKEKFGDRLSFQGGVSVQKTLPFGTVADVRREVADRIRVLARGGGYIFGPSHWIQSGTPPENVTAMFDAAASYRLLGRR